MDRLDAARVGLELRQTLRTNQLAAHTVLLTTLEDTRQLRQFGNVGRDNYFAADFVSDPVLATKCLHRQFSGSTILRPQTPRPVVNTGMQHAGISRRLMGGHFRFFLQHDQAPAGKSGSDFMRRGESDDAAAYYDQVASIHHNPPVFPDCLFRKSYQ